MTAPLRLSELLRAGEAQSEGCPRCGRPQTFLLSHSRGLTLFAPRCAMRRTPPLPGVVLALIKAMVDVPRTVVAGIVLRLLADALSSIREGAAPHAGPTLFLAVAIAVVGAAAAEKQTRKSAYRARVMVRGLCAVGGEPPSLGHPFGAAAPRCDGVCLPSRACSPAEVPRRTRIRPRVQVWNRRRDRGATSPRA